jgi:hypothetical protein
MLLSIIGLAVVVTGFTTGKINDGSRRSDGSLQSDGTPAVVDSDKDPNAKQAFFAVTYIPAGSKILSKEIEQRDVEELGLWDDAVLTKDLIVGHTAKHAIPTDEQIRQIDIDK